jgi:hypothetical protein
MRYTGRIATDERYVWKRACLGDLVLGGMIILKGMLNKKEVSVVICFIFRSLVRSKNLNNQQDAQLCSCNKKITLKMA